MTTFTRRSLMAAAGLAMLMPLSALSAESADMILHNGKVLVVDKAFSTKSALAIKDGKVLAVGGDEITKKYTAPTVIDLKGRTLMPGFNDTHVHMGPLVLAKRDIDAASARSIKELQDMLIAKSKELGPNEWIGGRGWDEALFAEKRNPTRADLDVVPNPVALARAGNHSIVGNSAAIKIAGITRDTPDPESGLIEKGPDGEPNGIIREANRMYLQHVPPNKWEDVRASYVAALRSMVAKGYTSIIEASGSLNDEPVGKGGIAAPSAGLTYKRLRSIYDERKDLPRLAMYISYPGAERLKAFPHKTGYGDEWLRLGPIGESSVDGGFTGPTAWTLVDYKGLPGFRGKPRISMEETVAMADTSAKLGWQMGIHAIGDAAIVQAVDAYSKAINDNGLKGKDHRWFLDHFTVMPPDATMKTMADDGIMIAQQPGFSYNLEARYESTLDDWRLAHNNSIATPVKKFGIFMAFGTDNLPIDPRVTLYVAVTRKGMSGKVHGPEEAVSMPEAIYMATAAGAVLTFEEKIKGTLEPGMLADMIVLDADPLTIDPEKLLTMNVDYTIIGGKIAHERK